MTNPPNNGKGDEDAPSQINSAGYGSAGVAAGDQNNNGDAASTTEEITSTTPSSNNGRSNVAPRRMDHTYHDWATYPPDDYELRRSRSKKTANNFVSNTSAF